MPKLTLLLLCLVMVGCRQPMQGRNFMNMPDHCQLTWQRKDMDEIHPGKIVYMFISVCDEIVENQ